MIVIIGKVAVQPDKLELFFSEINKAIEATQKEAGVSRYELAQSVGEPNNYLVNEEYANEAAIASHIETEHMKRLGPVLGTMVDAPPVGKKYYVTSTEML